MGKKIYVSLWWHFEKDVDKAGTILPFLHNVSLDDKEHQVFKNNVSDWQISRLWVIGSNEKTAPIIEASYKRFLKQFEQCLRLQPFLLGSRPSSADYAIYGQLTQLIGFDPTSRAIAHDISPRVISWLDLMEDMSGLEPKDSDWISFVEVQNSLSDIFKEIGRVYLPALLANAQAVANKEQTWTTQIDGAKWEQRSFPYQAKCLNWINEEFHNLNKNAQQQIMNFFKKTGCEELIIKG